MSSKKPVMSHDPLAVPDGDSSEPSSDEPASPAEPVAVDGGVLVLASSLTIADVGELQPQMATYLDRVDALQLDGAGVETIDGAGLQLLAAFVKELGSRSLAYRWNGASGTLLNAARQVGLSDLLRLEDRDCAA